MNPLPAVFNIACMIWQIQCNFRVKQGHSRWKHSTKKKEKVTAVFAYYRCSEMDLGFTNYSFICIWDCFVCFADFGLGFYLVMILYIGHFCLSKNLIFLMHWVHHFLFWSPEPIAPCNTARNNLRRRYSSNQNKKGYNLADKRACKNVCVFCPGDCHSLRSLWQIFKYLNWRT